MNHSPEKSQRLRQSGTLNPHPEKVIDEHFVNSEFFDPSDLLQVRYEMVRCVRLKKTTLAQAAKRFGVSRPTCFRLNKAFRIGGLQGLIPALRGPQKPHKITAEVLSFVDNYRSAFGHTSARTLVPVIEQEFNIRIHPRGLEKALERRQKKLHTLANDDDKQRTALRNMATALVEQRPQPSGNRDGLSRLV